MKKLIIASISTVSILGVNAATFGQDQKYTTNLHSPIPSRPANPELLAWSGNILDGSQSDAAASKHLSLPALGGTWKQKPKAPTSTPAKPPVPSSEKAAPNGPALWEMRQNIHKLTSIKLTSGEVLAHGHLDSSFVSESGYLIETISSTDHTAHYFCMTKFPTSAASAIGASEPILSYCFVRA